MVYSSNTNTSVDYLAGCNPVVPAPSYASLNEMAYHVIESTEGDFNNIMMSIGINELSHFEESGVEVVYEGAKLDSLVKKFTGFFQSMWEKVQGMIKKALDWFNEHADNLRKNLLSKVDEKFLQKRVDNLDANKVYIAGYSFTGLGSKAYVADGKSWVAEKVAPKVESSSKAVKELCENAASAIKTSGSKELFNELDDKLDAEVEKFIRVFSPESTSTTGLATNFKDYLRGNTMEYKGSYIKENFKGIFEQVKNYPATKRVLKADYNAQRKTFNNAIKDVKDLSKHAETEAAAFTKGVKALKDLRQVCVVAQQATISVLYEQYNLNKSIVLKVAGTKPVKESAYRESATVDGVESLFNW